MARPIKFVAQSNAKCQHWISDDFEWCPLLRQRARSKLFHTAKAARPMHEMSVRDQVAREARMGVQRSDPYQTRMVTGQTCCHGVIEKQTGTTSETHTGSHAGSGLDIHTYHAIIMSSLEDSCGQWQWSQNDGTLHQAPSETLELHTINPKL